MNLRRTGGQGCKGCGGRTNMGSTEHLRRPSAQGGSAPATIITLMHGVPSAQHPQEGTTRSLPWPPVTLLNSSSPVSCVLPVKLENILHLSLRHLCRSTTLPTTPSLLPGPALLLVQNSKYLHHFNNNKRMNLLPPKSKLAIHSQDPVLLSFFYQY